MKQKLQKMAYKINTTHPHEQKNQLLQQLTQQQQQQQIAIKNHTTQLLQAFSGYFKR